MYSTLRARKVCETTQRLIASPAPYLAEHGRPDRLDDLNAHRLLYLFAQCRVFDVEDHRPIG